MIVKKLVVSMLLLVILCACSGGEGQSEPSVPESGALTITFHYEKQSGYASNQFAVWMEDSEGNLVKTLYATRFTANGGYKNRPDAIPRWVEQSGLSSMRKSEVDAITGATPKAGTVSYAWDLTDKDGNAVAPGEYKFVVEGSLRWKNRVLYTGIIDTSGSAATVQGEAEYFYEESSDSPALSGDASENAMIGDVKAIWNP